MFVILLWFYPFSYPYSRHAQNPGLPSQARVLSCKTYLNKVGYPKFFTDNNGGFCSKYQLWMCIYTFGILFLWRDDRIITMFKNTVSNRNKRLGVTAGWVKRKAPNRMAQACPNGPGSDSNLSLKTSCWAVFLCISFDTVLSLFLSNMHYAKDPTAFYSSPFSKWSCILLGFQIKNIYFIFPHTFLWAFGGKISSFLTNIAARFLWE